jgi:hypothetical protein
MTPTATAPKRGVLASFALLLGLASVDGFALVVSDGQVVTVNSQRTEDVTVAAGGTLQVVEGAVIDGAITVSGSLIVTGGTLATNTRTHHIELENSGSAEISGGTFNTNNFYVQDTAELTVSGGVWNNHRFYIQDNARTNFSGGLFNGTIYYFQGDSISSISGGEFSLTGTLYSQGNGQVTITGGVFNDDAGGELWVVGSSSMEIRGGSFNLPIQVQQDGQLSIFGHPAFNYPFGSYEDGSDLDGATLTGRLFSGDTFSSTIAIDEDVDAAAKVTLVNLINPDLAPPAAATPVPTSPIWLLGIMAGLLSLVGFRKLRKA